MAFLRLIRSLSESKSATPAMVLAKTLESHGDWREDVRKCLVFQDYPKAIP
jgi:hypothetical protein